MLQFLTSLLKKKKEKKKRQSCQSLNDLMLPNPPAGAVWDRLSNFRLWTSGAPLWRRCRYYDAEKLFVFFSYYLHTRLLVNMEWQSVDCLTSPVMRKWFPSCTKIFTATACFWSNLLGEQLHDRPNVHVLSECNQANPSVAGFGDLVHDMRVINSRNAPCGVAIFRSCDKAPVVLICISLCFQGCLHLCLPADVHPLFSVAPCRALRFRCPHWLQSQALVVGSESFSLPGLVSYAVLVTREFRRFWILMLYLWACTF